MQNLLGEKSCSRIVKIVLLQKSIVFQAESFPEDNWAAAAAQIPGGHNMFILVSTIYSLIEHYSMIAKHLIR